MKKIISLVLSMIMLLSITAGLHLQALAASSGDFEYEILDDGTAEITNYVGEKETLEIPTTLEGYTVTSIGDGAFYDCDNLTGITIPDSVTSIEAEAFYSCDSLTSVDLGNGVTIISSGVFWKCNSLTNVTIPESVTSIYDYAFCNCHSLTNITVDENNKNYSSQDGVLFNKDKTSLIQYPIGIEKTSYIIPDSVATIGEHAFEGCKNLTNIKIPKITIICGTAFDDSSIKTIYGYENSYAQTFAEADGYEFVVFDNSDEQGIISEGTDDTYVIGSEKGASIHCGYPIDQFSGVLMDGAEVSADNYTLTEGSTILTFKPEYLNSLSAGKHEVTLNFASGSVKSILTIENKVPNTPTDSEKPGGTEKPAETKRPSAQGGTTSANGTGNGDATSPNTGSNASAIFAFATMTAAAAFLIIRKKKI